LYWLSSVHRHTFTGVTIIKLLRGLCEITTMLICNTCPPNPTPSCVRRLQVAASRRPSSSRALVVSAGAYLRVFCTPNAYNCNRRPQRCHWPASSNDSKYQAPSPAYSPTALPTLDLSLYWSMTAYISIDIRVAESSPPWALLHCTTRVKPRDHHAKWHLSSVFPVWLLL